MATETLASAVTPEGSPASNRVVMTYDESDVLRSVTLSNLVKQFLPRLCTLKLEYIDGESFKIIGGGVIVPINGSDVHVVAEDLPITFPTDLTSGESQLSNTGYYLWIGKVESTVTAKLSTSQVTAPSELTNAALYPEGQVYLDSNKNLRPFGVSSIYGMYSPAQYGFKAFPRGQYTSGYNTIILNDGSFLLAGNGANYVNLQQNSGNTNPRRYSFDSPIKEICQSYGTLYILLEDGRLFASGGNSSGQLGQGDISTYYVFVQVPLSNIETIRCSYSSSANSAFALDSSGNLYSWGENLRGALGDNTVADKYTPILTLTDVAFFEILANGAYPTAYAVKTDGTFWSWGENNDGQCGQGAAGGQYLIPTQIVGLTDITHIWPIHAYSTSANQKGFVFVKNATTLYCWGSGDDGPLGQGDVNDQPSPVDVTSSFPSLPIQVDGAHRSSLIVLADGTVYGSGLNSYGNLGNGNTTSLNTFTLLPVSNVAKVIANKSNLSVNVTIFLLKDGTVRTCGAKNGGSLGNGITGNNSSESTLQTPRLFDIVDVFCSGIPTTDTSYYGSSCWAVDSKGDLWEWGQRQSNNMFHTDSNGTRIIYNPSSVRL